LLKVKKNASDLNSVREICESVTAIQRVPDYRPHWLSTEPFLIREFSTPSMHAAVDAAFRSDRVDVLQCEYLQMAQFRRPGTFSVLTAIEAVSKNAWEDFSVQVDPVMKLRLFYRWMQMLHYEIPVTRKFDRVVTMTPEDAAYLSSYSPTANIRPISIGVDSEYFQPLPEAFDRPLEVLFVGNFRHAPNVEAVAFLIRHIAPSFQIFDSFFRKDVPPELLGVRTCGFPVRSRDPHSLQRPNTIVWRRCFQERGSA
jgi:glycosyltransferase involved in cell wall biosynthesis